MATILDYLNSVDADARMKKDHEADPVATMKRFGLSDEQCQAVMSGDSKKIAEVDGIEEARAASIQIPHTNHTSY